MMYKCPYMDAAGAARVHSCEIRRNKYGAQSERQTRPIAEEETQFPNT
jgi:hypothetical protein